MALGCAAEPLRATGLGLDAVGPAPAAKTGSGASGSGAGTSPDACSSSASWRARSDLAFDGSTPRPFADALNALVKAQAVSPFAVSNYVDAHCDWKVTFSASDDVGGFGSSGHPATYTAMYRHPAGLWTTAPQDASWLQIVDAAGQTIWIPLGNVTGSANFGADDCSSLSTAEVAATLPRSAAATSLTTAEGHTTLGALLGPLSAPSGWRVHFGFSANALR